MIFNVFKTSSDSKRFEIFEVPTAWEASSIVLIDKLLSELTLIVLLNGGIFSLDSFYWYCIVTCHKSNFTEKYKGCQIICKRG